MLQVLAPVKGSHKRVDLAPLDKHANLSHQLILVAIHAGELTNVGERVLKTIGKLESIDIAETVLDVRVDHELAETQDLANKMEGVSETRLLALLGGQSLDGLQVEIVVEVEIVETLSVDQQVEHVVSLAAHLQTNLNPVQRYNVCELLK
jgi:hypothetical protein